MVKPSSKHKFFLVAFPIDDLLGQAEVRQQGMVGLIDDHIVLMALFAPDQALQIITKYPYAPCMEYECQHLPEQNHPVL